MSIQVCRNKRTGRSLSKKGKRITKPYHEQENQLKKYMTRNI